MFVLKQFVGAMASPFMVAIVLLAIAGLCGYRGKRRAALWLSVLCGSIVYAGSLKPVSELLLSPLEREYEPLAVDLLASPVAAIVVLGSNYVPRGGIPVSAALGDDGLARIVEGVRLARQFPEARLILSGGAPKGQVPSAVGYAELALELGIAESAITVLDTPLDTGDEAKLVGEMMGKTPFILVTSAYHMPRAMRLMRLNGSAPVPAPTGHRGGAPMSGIASMVLPSSGSMANVERALHEYLGLAALRIGQE